MLFDYTIADSPSLQFTLNQYRWSTLLRVSNERTVRWGETDSTLRYFSLSAPQDFDKNETILTLGGGQGGASCVLKAH